MSVYDRRSVSTCCIYNPGDSSTWSKPMNDEKIASYGNQLKGTLWTSWLSSVSLGNILGWNRESEPPGSKSAALVNDHLVIVFADGAEYSWYKMMGLSQGSHDWQLIFFDQISSDMCLQCPVQHRTSFLVCINRFLGNVLAIRPPQLLMVGKWPIQFSILLVSANIFSKTHKHANGMHPSVSLGRGAWLT